LILIGVIIIASSVYVCLIYWIHSFWKIKPDHETGEALFSPNVSVIIAARNEEDNISKCVQSIISNDFEGRRFEIIVIDDHSDDKTKELINGLKAENVKVISLPEGHYGKKNALTLGIKEAQYPIILTTDADCVTGRNWLSSHSHKYINEKISLCTSFVLPFDDKSILSSFQFFDLASTIATTKAGIDGKQFYLANGANMSFRKDSFLSVEGYAGNVDISSGDDIFLINKIVKSHPDSVRFVNNPDSVVWTKSEKSWTDLIKQRIRWASKSSKTNNISLMILQGYIFLFSCLLVVGLFLSLFFSAKAIALYLWLGLLIKGVTDFIFLRDLSTHFKRPIIVKDFIICFFIYFIHIIGSGLVALFPLKYTWKGRKVR
jgi:poly-beta-1,6-N-acetyl-D-glucosamine synthase